MFSGWDSSEWVYSLVSGCFIFGVLITLGKILVKWLMRQLCDEPAPITPMTMPHPESSALLRKAA